MLAPALLRSARDLRRLDERSGWREYAQYVTARLPALHRAAYLLAGDAHRADDIVQATLTALYLHWRKARAAGNIDAYVHKMLTHQFLDEKRLACSRVLLGWAQRDLAAPAVISLEDHHLVHAALRKLPKGQRAVLVLRFLCSTGNVKSQTSRALQAMRALLPSRSQA